MQALDGFLGVMDEIELTVIGCGDPYATRGRFHTCFYVTSLSCNFLIDCGSTAFTSLKQNEIRNEDIDLILISHFHGDHYGALPFFILDADVFKRKKPLTIISPPGAKEKVDKLFELLYPDSKLAEDLKIQFIEYQDNEILSVGPLKVLALPVRHKKATLPHGLRITIEDTVISFSGDTGWTSALEDLAKDADLFICECSFYESDVEGHMNYKTLSDKLPNLAFKRILLTHLGEEMFENLGNVKLDYATDGLKIKMNSKGLFHKTF